MGIVETILLAIAGPVARMVENATSDNYDKEAELQALMDIESAIADARMKAALTKKSP